MRGAATSRGWIRACAVALGVLATTALACDEPAFVCESHDDCTRGRSVGYCEAEGYCSFADPSCASGRVWGDLSPDSIANECVAIDGTACATSSCATATDDDDAPPDRDGELPAPTRDPSDPPEPSAPPELPHQLPDLAHCDDGVQDRGESDVDCGGDCAPCMWCEGCFDDADCGEGTCEAGQCRTIATMTVDWTLDCGDIDDFAAKLVLPPGAYVATALPSAGSRWSHDGAVDGLTWQWRIDCRELSFGDLRTPGDARYATPEEAYAALVTDRALVQLDADEGDPASSSLACGFADSYCDDNRGTTIVQLENWCP